MVGRQRNPAVLPRISLCIGGLGKAKVERRAIDNLTSCRRDCLIAPSPPPALFDLGRKRRCYARNERPPEQSTEDAVNQPSRSAVNERQSCRHDRMIGHVHREPLGKRKTQHHARLAVIWNPLEGRAVDQCVQLGNSPKSFADDGLRESLITRCEILRRRPSRIHCLSAAEDTIQDSEGGTPGLEAFGTWRGRRHRPSRKP